jgi:hypothetical protein
MKTKGEITLSIFYKKKRVFLSRANKTRGKLTLIVSDEKRLFLLRWEKNQTKLTLIVSDEKRLFLLRWEKKFLST